MAFACAAAVLLQAAPVWAVQTHGQPEGLVAHQLAHLFFSIALGTLTFWLHRMRLIKVPGWRLIGVAAILLILWNVDAMTAHFLDEQIDLLQVTRVDNWRLRIVTRPGYELLGPLYYLVQMDHLLSVPALVSLYLGLKRLAQGNQPSGGKEPGP